MDQATQNHGFPSSKKHYSRRSTFSHLIAIATQNSIPGITRKSLCHLLDILGPPALLQRLFLVLSNLAEIYAIVPDISGDTRWRTAGERIGSTKKICSTVLDHRAQILNKRGLYEILELRFHKHAKSSNNDSFRGLIKKFPFWCSLGHQPVGGCLDQFNQLLAHILLSSVVMQRHPAASLLKNIRKNALTAVRVLANDETAKELEALPVNLLSPENYYKELKKLPEDFRVHEIARFLEEAIDFVSTDWGEGASAEHQEEPHDKVHSPEMPLDDQTILADYEDPVPAGFEILLGRAGGGLWTGAQISKSLAKANQLFPFARSTLSRSDITVLIDYLDPNIMPIADPTVIQVRALLSLMLWGGLDETRLAAVCSTSVLQAGVDHPDSDLYCPLAGTLRLISTFPKLKTPVPAKARGQLFERQFYVDLSLPGVAVESLNCYLAQQETNDSKKLFPLTPAEIKSSCQKGFRSLARAHNVDLSPVRIHNFLQNRLARTVYGDPATAVLILGKDIFLGRSKVHYASFDAYDLQELYRRTVHDIFREVGRESVFASQYPAAKTLNVGTPKRPKMEIIRDLFASLIEKLSRLRSWVKSIEDLVAYHNLYATYTVLVVFFSTGHRPIRSPYISESHIDSETGFFVLRDKDTPDYYHTRLCWMPQVCRTQLKHYRIHLKRLLGQVGYKGHQAQEEETGFFYLKKDLQAEEVRPQNLATRLEALGYYAALNAQRHFLKSELQEDGCAADVVELFLGHWEVGEEGFTRSSALFPFDYRAELDRHLTPLLKRIGILPCKGLASLPRRLRGVALPFLRSQAPSSCGGRLIRSGCRGSRQGKSGSRLLGL